MTTQEFQSQIIDTCKQKGACKPEFQRLLYSKDQPDQFLQVLRDNHMWCVDKQIYTPQLLLQLDADLLLRGGFATHGTKPVNFEPVEIGDNTWAPLNHGASIDDINGSYHNFDEALTLDYGKDWRQPTADEHCDLASAANMFGIYVNSFGRVFEGKNDNLFIPASGYRNYNTGAFYAVGAYGYLWSSSVYGYRHGFYLRIHQTAGVIPRNANYRAVGFPVRCVSL